MQPVPVVAEGKASLRGEGAPPGPRDGAVRIAPGAVVEIADH